MSRYIGVDVDGVVVDTNKLWLSWCCQNTGDLGFFDLVAEDLMKFDCKLEYDLSKYFLDIDVFSYWRSRTLYDNLLPLSRSVEKLQTLSQYFDIVFVSRLKGDHHASKVRFLKKHFPFMKGFIGTHEKFILADSLTAMFDDRLDNLKGFPEDKRILVGSEYTQTVNIPVAMKIDSWDNFSVKEFCDNYL